MHDIRNEGTPAQELRRTVERYEQLLAVVGDGILLLDGSCRILEANRIASELLGRPAERLPGEDFRRFLAGHDAELLEEMVREIGRHGAGRRCTDVRLAAAPGGVGQDVEICLGPARAFQEPRFHACLRDISQLKKVENKLLEANRKFRKIAEMGEDAILVLGDGFQVEYANSRASDVTGFSSKELTGMDFLALLDPGDRKLFPDLHRQDAETGGRRICVQWKLITASRKPRRCEVCFSSARFSGGGRKTYVYIRDLSERVRMENKLREANEFLSNIIESSVDGIIAADMKGTVIIFNKGAEALLGYRAEEVVGKFNVSNFYPPGVARDIMRRLRGEESGGKGRVMPHRIIGVSRSGEQIPISLSGALIYQDGREIASVGIFYDLREILKTQEELLETEARFRDLFETVRHGLYFSSREGKFLDCNPAMVEMLGYGSKEEVLAMNLAHDLYLEPSHRMEFQRRVESQGYVKDYEVVFKKKSGEPITVLLTAHVRKDRSGTVSGYQGLFIDTTERRKLEQQLFQSEKLAAMGRLTAQIAHELNNPIYGVMNCLDLLKSEVPETSRKRKFLDMASSETQRISELLRGMLSFFRPDEDVKAAVNLNAIIEEVILFVGKQLNEFKIRVVQDLEPGLPPVFASGNQMKQVLLNLIMNSRNAMSRGGTLTISTRTAGGKLLLKVSDTGAGIPPEVRDRIFEAFFTTKSDVKGVGLGLSVCFGIVHQHGGTIEVESEVGKGATFTITLPLRA